MSTFNGLVSEFPDIRIDFFRRHPGLPQPLACFLSHVHSDHLAGLDSLRSPFIYCSAATKEILLRLERYPCRINYARGITECRTQTFKHLKSLLKPIPLETPTTLELAPGHQIQITLFDANHCPGAVMFLIEGSGKAILYTGDIRSEPWFVNAITRNPAMVEYSSGIRTLDKIYLDTSFVEEDPFQTKAEGIAELLRKVSCYPKSTIFHLQAWTYGYENVWIALSKALASRIHVDDYKMRVYGSLTAKSSSDRFSSSLHLCPEAPALTGYMFGNTPHPGCLTRDENVRIHSCEKGNLCSVAREPNVVSIQPIIAHLKDGVDLVEIGVGGGSDDLGHDAELDLLSEEEIGSFLELISESKGLSDEVRVKVQEFLLDIVANGRNISLELDTSTFDEMNETQLHNVVDAILKKMEAGQGRMEHTTDVTSNILPMAITFPYSRHSSYPELCLFVQAFRPKDVWPCTVQPLDWLKRNISIGSLFGKYCSGDVFEHDVKMRHLADMQETIPPPAESQPQFCSQISLTTLAAASSCHHLHSTLPQLPVLKGTGGASIEGVSIPTVVFEGINSPGAVTGKRDFARYQENNQSFHDSNGPRESGSFGSNHSLRSSHVRADAYHAMTQNVAGGEWVSIGLISTSDNHSILDAELDK